MKDLPNEVLYVKYLEAIGGCMGATYYNEIVDKYPEHFPEVIEHRRKWALVPKEEFNAYVKELMANNRKAYSESTKGLWAYIQDKDYREKVDKQQEENKADVEIFEKNLYNKYFNKYGLRK